MLCHRFGGQGVTMLPDLGKVSIHYHRLGKPVAIYVEGFVEDDGRRLRTFSVVPQAISREWSLLWRRNGMIPPEKRIGFIRKYLFYDECFTIMEVRDTGDGLLGYYCDMATPMKKMDGEYHLTDLFLDLWITPGPVVRELDWDEFEAAVREGLLTPEWQSLARQTIARLKEDVGRGIFPGVYVSNPW
jgi:hypothetical protein